MTGPRARVALAALLVVLGLLGASVPATGQAEPTGLAVADIVDTAGRSIGGAFFFEDDENVFVDVFVEGLSPGFHGMHLHQTGLCAAPFTTAGGHHNPGATGHGAHAGDLPSLLVDAEGFGFSQFQTDRFTIAELVAGDGSALVVHAGRDNFANVPDRYQSTQIPGPGPDLTTLDTGDSGTRVACGVLDGEVFEQQARAAHAAAERRAAAAAADRAATRAARAPGDAIAAEARLRDVTGAEVGVVRFFADPELGFIDALATARRLQPGFHGMHIHRTGECRAPFTTAGTHHAPTASDHGDHAGDLPPLEVDSAGRGVAQFSTDRTDLAELLSGDGTAVIIHADPDNFANIPDRYTAAGSPSPGPDADTLATGDSGARVACGFVRELSSTELYVDAVYTIVLGRQADLAGRNHWVDYIEGGGRRSLFTAALLGSAELAARYVEGYYGLYLGRAPDPSGLRFWTNYLRRPGSTLLVLEQALLASPELYEQVGGTPTAFVEAAYQILLFRDVDAAARRYWVGRIEAGTGRARVVRELLTSAEATRQRVSEAYFVTVGREPRRGELRLWAGFLARGGDIRPLYAALTASAEFFDVATSGGGETLALAGGTAEGTTEPRSIVP